MKKKSRKTYRRLFKKEIVHLKNPKKIKVKHEKVEHLRAQLNYKGISKEFILQLKEELLGNYEAYDILLDLALSEDRPLNQKSAWLISHISNSDSRILTRNLNLLIDKIQNVKPDGVIRDLMRGFKNIPLSDFDHGLVLDLCFTLMNEGHRDLAVKYNSMKILERLIKIYPDLKNEFIESLEIQIELDQTTFAGHARKVLKKLG